MKTLREFRESREIMSKKTYNRTVANVYDGNQDDLLYVYDGYIVIEKIEGAYSFIYQNREFEEKKLSKLEVKAWDEHKFEKLHEEEIEADLHERSVELLDKLSAKCSLDELDLSLLSKKFANKVRALLEVWLQLDEHSFNEKFLSSPSK